MIWLLPGLGRGPRAVHLSTAIVLALLCSRLLLLPDGPWEQDEALFATGVIDFDVPRHRPHPPGFPGWIAIGKLLQPLTGDALLALQIASSLASVLTVIVLARLLVPLAGERAALLGALAYATAPLCWVHAPRAFSTTPALACTIVAVALWANPPRGSSRNRSLAAWALLGFAATIRPQLAPALAVVAVLGAYVDRRRIRRVIAGFSLGAAIVVAAYGWAALSAHRPSAYWRSLSSHFARHGRDLATDLTWAELGAVRGLGGGVVAASVAVAAIAGIGLAARRDRRLGAWLAALVGVTCWSVLGQHHPGFPRYAVALLLTATPAVVIAVAALPHRVGALLLLAAIVAGTPASLGPLLAMHEHPLPPMAALRQAELGAPTQLIYSHGSFSFARYVALSRRLELPFVDVKTPETIPAVHRGAYALAGRSVHFLPGATVCIETFDAFPRGARALSQGRFTSASIARDAILLGSGVHRPETTEAGDPFVWLSGTADLHVPGGSTGLALQVRVPDAHAPQPLRASIRGQPVLDTSLDAGPHTVRVPLPGCEHGCVTSLQLPGARPTGVDRRRLSLRLEAAWSEGPDVRAAAHVWSPGRPASLRPAGVELDGVYGPEEFSRGRAGAWTKGIFRARFPAGPATLRLRLARPLHTPGPVTFVTDAGQTRADVGPEITAVELRVNAPDLAGWLEIRAPTFVPADVKPHSTDARELGVILFDVAYIPDGDRCGDDNRPARTATHRR